MARSTRIPFLLLILALTGSLHSVPVLAQEDETVEALGRADALLLQDHAPGEALGAYQAILSRDPSNVEALWRASRACLVLGILAQDWDTRRDWHREGAELARKAEELEPDDPDLTYWRVANLGRWAQEEPGARTALRLAREIRTGAEEILRTHPDHAGAHNVLGMFFFETLNLSTPKRAVARLLAPGTLTGVHWDEAHNHLRRAVSLDPFNILYLKDYGRALLWNGEEDEARAYLERALAAPVILPTDGVFQREAQTLLEELAKEGGSSPSIPPPGVRDIPKAQKKRLAPQDP